MNWVFVATTAFLTECVQQQAAGAFALGNLLRNPAAAISALLIPTLVNKMGAGWCFTGLALVDLVLVGGAVMGKLDSFNNVIRLTTLQCFESRVLYGGNSARPEWHKPRP